jgi:hypothetical protein
MKRHIPQAEVVTQLALFESHDPAPASAVPPETEVSTESKEAYELRRTWEMAEKLHWPALHLEPVRNWPGVTIPEGKAAWSNVLDCASSGTVGLIMLALHKHLAPLTPDSIDEQTGLFRHRVEVISRVEERYRARMMQLAELLEWPHISYWSANRTQVLGPGETAWHAYGEYGSAGLVADAVGALERRLRGEPDRVKQAPRLQVSEDEED